MKLTRILSLLLALLTVASLLCACKPDENDDPNAQEPVATSLSLIVNGETDFVIVYDNKASDEIVSAIQALTESIQNNIGASLTLQPCFMDRQEESDVVGPKEILIGMTNREESTGTLGTMRSKDFTICTKNGKLIIGGGGEAGTLSAITSFINDFVVAQGNRYAVKQGQKQNLIFSSDKAVNEVGTYSYTSAHLMGISLDQFGIIYPKKDYIGEELARELSAHISAQSGYDLSVYQDATKWCDFEIRVGNAKSNIEHHNPDIGCVCDSLAFDQYYIKLVKTQVTYEDGSIHDGARLYICFGANAKDAAYKAFTEQIMPILAEATAFTMDEGFELTNRTAS